MSRRIDIELTSARPDGTWTWRAAGAREPKGVLDGALLPADAKAGAVLRADADFELDGITILAVMSNKEKSSKSGLLALIPSDKPFEAVTQQLARKERRDRGDRDRGDRGDRGPRGDRPRRDGDSRGPRSDRPVGDGARRDRPARDGAPRGERADRPRRQRPHFDAPPELPQRPKPKRLRPGRKHRSAVLADLPEAQRPVAERALQGGIPAVRQAVNEQNARLKAEGKEEIPAAGLLSMAEQLLPKLRVAEWLDRADAAIADMDELDLRDLRSVVAAAEDPMVARDESTRGLAEQLKTALVTKQERELTLWFEDIDAAIGVGRIVRALKLSSQPPKAGIRFPVELAGKLAAAASESLSTDALPDRWVAVLESVAFSPVRSQVHAAAKPDQVNDDLTATVKRIAPLLPQIAALFGVEVKEGGAPPKPLRPTRATAKKPAAKPASKPPAPKQAQPKPAPAEANQPADDAPADSSASAAAVDDKPGEGPVDAAPEHESTKADPTDTVQADTVQADTVQADTVQADTVHDDTGAAVAESAAAPVADPPEAAAPEAEAGQESDEVLSAAVGDPDAESTVEA
jgi:hypothetical protein